MDEIATSSFEESLVDKYKKIRSRQSTGRFCMNDSSLVGGKVRIDLLLDLLDLFDLVFNFNKDCRMLLV